ncbi:MULTISPECIES: hypothetical protein [unclassified Dietzia]|uniref:hypothetical protein n=1 Tax=unclassified Dietzia TaxID=2617939 RepID=UPI0013166FD8|nr:MULTISPECIES: hypothetical protein [unclassified Dietzia]QGW26465.1 type III restriction enzyme res subunit [Dietzia sp. DQ12-45-1b]
MPHRITAASPLRTPDPEEPVIDRINDLFAGDHPDSSVRNVVTHIKDRLEESETLKTQARNNSLAQFRASPDIDVAFTDAVIGSMDSSADLSAQILNNQDLARALLGELLPAVYRTLSKAS